MPIQNGLGNFSGENPDHRCPKIDNRDTNIRRLIVNECALRALNTETGFENELPKLEWCNFIEGRSFNPRMERSLRIERKKPVLIDQVSPRLRAHIVVALGTVCRILGALISVVPGPREIASHSAPMISRCLALFGIEPARRANSLDAVIASVVQKAMIVGTDWLIIVVMVREQHAALTKNIYDVSQVLWELLKMFRNRVGKHKCSGQAF